MTLSQQAQLNAGRGAVGGGGGSTLRGERTWGRGAVSAAAGSRRPEGTKCVGRTRTEGGNASRALGVVGCVRTGARCVRTGAAYTG